LADKDTGEIFCDKLRQIYIELPAFKKSEEECETDFERWIFILKNMEIMERMPFKARKAIFDRLEQIASKANMSPEERQQYETECKIYNDYFNTIDSAKREGREEGREEGRQEGRQEGREEGIILVARNLKRMGMTTNKSNKQPD
jgi:predicted transposase/invertase (TIGR01784 family)